MLLNLPIFYTLATFKNEQFFIYISFLFLLFLQKVRDTIYIINSKYKY